MDAYIEVRKSAWEADRAKQTKLVDTAFEQQTSNLIFKIDDSESLDLELLASCYLLTNAYLMGRQNRGCLKLFRLTRPDVSLSHATENYLRPLLGGEYSALSNLSNWVAKISEHVDLTEDLLFYAEKTVSALSSFDGQQRGHLNEPADVVLIVSESDGDDRLDVQLAHKTVELSVFDKNVVYPAFRQARGNVSAWATCENSACYLYIFNGGTNAAFVQSWFRYLKDINLTWNTHFSQRN